MTTSPHRRALDDPRTRDALRHYRLRCFRATLVGFAGLVVAVVVGDFSPDGDPQGVVGIVWLIGICWGGMALGVGVCTLVRSLRMGHVFRRHLWVERRARYRIAPWGQNGQPALLVKEDAHGPEAVCSVSATVWRYEKLGQGSDVPILVIGDPGRWAVVAPPDLSVLLVVKRPWLPFWRKKLRSYAMEA